MLNLNRASVIQVVLSEHNLAKEEGVEQVLNVSKIYSHFAYNPKTFNNDILLIKVSNTTINPLISSFHILNKKICVHKTPELNVQKHV